VPAGKKSNGQPERERDRERERERKFCEESE